MVKKKNSNPLETIMENKFKTLTNPQKEEILREVGLLNRLYIDLPEGSLAEKIRKLRKINGLGLVGFSERVGVSVSAIKSWEDEDITPSKTSIKKICTAFDLDESYFVFKNCSTSGVYI